MGESIQIWFQNLFSWGYPFWDAFWIVVTGLGGEIMFLVALPTLYWIMDKKLMKIIGASVMVGILLNGILKDSFQVVRPIDDVDVRFVSVDNAFVSTEDMRDSYSFPSGHAQNISTGFFTAAFLLKKKWFYILSIVLVVLVCLSRIYLGVHWPLDVLVGSVVGLITAFLMYKLFMKCENKTLFIYIGIIIAGIITIIFELIMSGKADSFKSAGAVIGFGAGAIFEDKLVNFNPKAGKSWKKVVRVLIGLVIIIGLYVGLKFVFSAILGGEDQISGIVYSFITMILAFVAIGAYPWLFKKINL
ncbi:MAG: phosphatase PAP2 family protein [Bacilli bacterium]